MFVVFLLRLTHSVSNLISFRIQGNSCRSNVSIFAGAKCSVFFLENTPLHSFWCSITFASDSSNNQSKLHLRWEKHTHKKKCRRNLEAHTEYELWAYNLFSSQMSSCAHHHATSQQWHDVEACFCKPAKSGHLWCPYHYGHQLPHEIEAIIKDGVWHRGRYPRDVIKPAGLISEKKKNAISMRSAIVDPN